MSFWNYSFESLAFDDKKNNAELVKRTMKCLGYKEAYSASLDEFGMEGPAWDFNWANITVLDYESAGFSNKELLSLLNTLFSDISLYYVYASGNNTSDYYSGTEITYDIPTLTYTEREIDYCYGDGTAFGRRAKSDDLKKEGTRCSESKIQKNEIYNSLSTKIVNILIENATKKGYQELVDLVKYKIGKQNNNVIIDGDTLVKGPIIVKNYVIPDSVKTIGDEAFKDLTDLISVTIPDSVTSIGKDAFEGCSSLTSITIPDSVTSIGDSAFGNCSSLTSITIPDSVTSIGNYAFSGCTSLTSITIPDSVTSIGVWAFWGCTSLTSITIPDRVKEIGWSAFSDCTSLTSITIPDSVTSIGGSAFEGCASLTSINVSSNNKSFCIIDGALYNKKQSRLLVVPRTKANITIPNSVKIIEKCAFEDCSSLTSITLPDSVTSIGYCAFKGCTSLKSITIPKSVREIREEAFYGCNALKKITFLNPETKLRSDVFDGFPEEFYDSSPDITVHMNYNDLINYVKFNKLSTEIQAKIVMTHKGKLFNQYYSENITDKKANEIAQAMISLLNEKTTRKECDAVISFMIEFRNVLSDDSVNMLFDTLNVIPKGKQALQECNLTNSDSIRDYIDKTNDKKTTKKSDDADKSINVPATASLNGLKFVVTGDLERFPDRNDFKSFIEACGGKLIGSVSSKTNYLITNDPDSGTVKNQKAKELGVKVISEDEFFKMLEESK